MWSQNGRAREQVGRVLEWLATGGVAWFVVARRERLRLTDGRFEVESPVATGARADVVLAGDVALAEDPVVAGLLAQSARDAWGAERHVALACGEYRVHTAYVGAGWTLGALVPADLDAVQLRERIERAAAVLRRAVERTGVAPPTPNDPERGGPTGAPAHPTLAARSLRLSS
jgi:hypothetical protein